MPAARGDAALLPGLGGWDGAASCPPGITQYMFKVKKASSSAGPQFLPSAQGAIPLAWDTHGVADPKAPYPKCPAAAGQSSRRGQKPDRSFFSAGSATQHGRSPVFIGSLSRTSSSGSLFMPWVKKRQELAPAMRAMSRLQPGYAGDQEAAARGMLPTAPGTVAPLAGWGTGGPGGALGSPMSQHWRQQFVANISAVDQDGPGGLLCPARLQS